MTEGIDLLGMTPVRERMRTDPKFYGVTRTLLGLLEGGQVTVADLAQAVVVASQMYAERNCAPVVLVLKELGHDG